MQLELIISFYWFVMVAKRKKLNEISQNFAGNALIFNKLQ